MQSEPVLAAAPKRGDADFTSEAYKVRLQNVAPFWRVPELRKMLANLALPKAVKIVKGEQWDFAFMTFENEEEQSRVIAALDGCNYRNFELSASRAAPKSDDVRVRIRAGEPSAKRVCLSEENPDLTPSDALNDQVTAYWRKPYPEQLAVKYKDMAKALVKVAQSLAPPLPQWAKSAMAANRRMVCPLADVVPSPVLNDYRNKCEFTFGRDPDGQIVAGFLLGAWLEGTVTVVEPSACVHIPAQAKVLCAAFQAHIQASPLPVYNRIENVGAWRGVMTRTTSTGEGLAMVIVNDAGMTAEQVAELEANLVADFTKRVAGGLPLNSLLIQINNTKNGHCDNGTRTTLLWGEPCLHDTMAGLKFRISPFAFFQVNTEAARVLMEVIRDLCLEAAGAASSQATLLDICCGTGNIGLFLAKSFSRVVGLEIVEGAVLDAKFNAEMNGIKNAKFIAGKAEETLPRVLASNQGPFLGVVDPPRAGLHKDVVKTIRQNASLKTLVYVSCSIAGATQNLVDFCRETSKTYRGKPFRIVKAVPVDLFPHTNHCELVLLLSRDESAAAPEVAAHVPPDHTVAAAAEAEAEAEAEAAPEAAVADTAADADFSSGADVAAASAQAALD